MGMIEERLAPRGGTVITAAVLRSLEEAHLIQEGRCAVLLLTDGEDEQFNRNVRKALATNVAHETPPVFADFMEKINPLFVILAVGREVDYKNLSLFADIMKGSFYLLPNPETLPQDLAVIIATVFETIHNQSIVYLGNPLCFSYSGAR